MGRNGWMRAAGVLTGLAATTGLLVGMRAVVSVGRAGPRLLLGLPDIPSEALGLAWSARAIWPAELQAAALTRMASLLAALFLAAASVALLNAAVLLAEAGAARWREMAVRAAVGATPGRLVRRLLRDVRLLVGLGGGMGLLLGSTTGAALRLLWPGPVRDAAVLQSLGYGVAVLAAATVVAAASYSAVGLLTARRGALARPLASGGRVSADRRAVFLRRTLSVVQTGTAGAVLMGSAVLALAVRAPDAPGEGADLVVLSATRPADVDGWEAVLERIRALPGTEAETLATPGALVGLGVRDHVTAQCGNCYRGGLPMPFWGAVADHHAVAPGYFEAVGLALHSGRALTVADGADAPRVAVVNRTFALSSFEDGQPLGRMIRLGTDLDAWYTVVGVVDDAPSAAVGGDERAREAVWVSALQHPPVHASVLVRGGDEAVAAASAALVAAGFGPGPAHSVTAHRRHAAAPLAWLAGVALGLGGITFLLALHGTRATALQVTRRRTQDLAVRRVHGATDRRIVAHVLGGAARTGLWGGGFALFFGTLGIALIRKTAAGVPMLGAGPLLLAVGALVLVSVASSVEAAREALRVEPAAALD